MRGRSLERQLPLLISAVLAGILATSLVLTYETLRETSEDAVRARLGRAARQVASSVAGGTRARAELLRTMAAEPALRPLLAGPDSITEAVARLALSRHLSAFDSSLTLELWDGEGRRVTTIGPERRASAADALRRVAPLATARQAPLDSVHFSPMYASGGRVYFWGIAAVREENRRVGYLVQERQVTGPREVPRVFQELMGEDASLHLRNADGDVWVSAPGDAEPAPVERDSTADGVTHVRPGKGVMIAAEAPIAGPPWLVVVETPLGAVAAAADDTAMKLAMISLLLMGVGAALSWLISRRITRPLVSLATEAESIARGEHARRVEVKGQDELARLAASFNQMANDVADSRQALEERVMEAQRSASALEKANADLQEAIRDAERARTEAERANRAKGDFLAVMSHELRTPLNAIAGYAQLLELGVHGPLTPAQEEALSRISRSQAHLLRLINDVLNFARIDAGHVRYDMEAVPLNETLVALEPLVATQMQAKGLTFTYSACDAELAVRADREKLSQIMLNLLSNAIKFTAAGGRVEVKCEPLDSRVRIAAIDTGIGIPEEQLSAVFDPFVQGDRALNRPHDGVGLGLAISRDLARGMGGDLTVVSTPGEGSTFTLTLERAELDPVGARIEHDEAHERRRH